MATSIKAINYGLILAHQKKIFDIDEDNKRARTAKSIYDLVLKEVLSSRNWGFAKKRVALSLDGSTPAYDWDFGFVLPGDYLKLVEVQDNIPYVEENNLLLSNDNTMKIQYIFLQDDPNKYSPTFITTLGTRLAVDFALSLALDVNLSEKLFAIYSQRIAIAGSISSQSGGLIEPSVEGWLESRGGGRGFGIGRGGQD